jgi:drug/metabolite transporter (DMT)-like permease
VCEASCVEPIVERRPAVGTALLLLAAVFWGFGFYAQRVSISQLSPLLAIAVRFSLTLPVSIGALVWCRRRGTRLPWRAGVVMGALWYLGFALQTEALLHTPVTRVALLTGLYAVFTPLLQPAFGLGRPTFVQGIAAFIALLGTLLLCGVVGDSAALSTPANIGDALTIVMAVLSAVCVLVVGRVAPHEDPVALNAIQILVMAVVSVVVAPVLEPESISTLQHLDWSSETVLSLLYLAVFSTICAFLLQLLGQRHLSPTPATIVMLLETPIGVLAAVALLHEAMAGWQWAGAALAVAAVVLAVAGERRTARQLRAQ